MQPALSQVSSSCSFPSKTGVNSPFGYLDGFDIADKSGVSRYSGGSNPR